MNKDCKPFNNSTFIYPYASGIYSAREFNYYAGDSYQFAVSSYYRNGEEGTMVIDGSVFLMPSKHGYAYYPVSIYQNNEVYSFWSEFDGGWHVKGTLGGELPRPEGNLFVHSACIDKSNNIWLACELMNGYMNSDIILLKFANSMWEISEKLNSSNIFCKRPQIAAGSSDIFIVWDGYSNDGYDIYFNCIANDTFTGEKRITKSKDWHLRPSISVSKDSSLLIAWLKNTDVERDGVISKTNHVMMAKYDVNCIRPVPGNDCEEVLRLDLGLLPNKRYFGYHGLRRNPQVACCGNGDIALFWEMQRDERENWDNVENGYFLCMFYSGQIWSKPFLIQDGGNCFTIDSTFEINDTIKYAYRGAKGIGPDIHFGTINVIDLLEFELPHYISWDKWKPVKYKAALNKRQGLYWGDLHCHSIYSPDAEGYPDELFFYARDRSTIDFCAITDNDIYGDNILTMSALRYIQSLSESLSKDGVFQAYTGYEWTYHRPGLDEPDNFNHRTVIFLDDNHIMASRADSTGYNEAAFSTTLGSSNTMWHAHHGIWRILDPKHDANVEIVSAWANNIQEYETVHRQLAEGQVFGFMGASDSHRYIPGCGGALTGVFAEQLSKAALEKAIFNRHNYATCGNKTYIGFSINGFGMGEIISAGKKEDLVLSLQVESKRNIEYIAVICNEEPIDIINLSKNEYKQEFLIPHSKANKYFYIKIKLEGEDLEFLHNLAIAEGNYIYSSPIWVKAAE